MQGKYTKTLQTLNNRQGSKTVPPKTGQGAPGISKQMGPKDRVTAAKGTQEQVVKLRITYCKAKEDRQECGGKSFIHTMGSRHMHMITRPEVIQMKKTQMNKIKGRSQGRTIRETGWKERGGHH